jgi:hypothetical protein
MSRHLWLTLTASLVLGLCVSLPAQEKQDKEPKKKGDAPTGQLLKSKDSLLTDGDKGATEVKAKKPDAALAPDIQSLRDSKDPGAVEIVALYNEIDRAYTEMATARNVATGEDREARKAKRDIKGYEATIKRQTRKLEIAVDHFGRPFEKDYSAAKQKFDVLNARAKQLEEQGHEKRATEAYQQANRYTGQMESAKRQLDAVRSFLYFQSAEGLELGGDADVADESLKATGEGADPAAEGKPKGDAEHAGKSPKAKGIKYRY